MRYSPIYTCMFNSFFNRYPIKPNLIYVNDPAQTRTDVKTDPNRCRSTSELRREPILYRPKVIPKQNKNHMNSNTCKNTNKINKLEKDMKYKYIKRGAIGTLLFTFFYSYHIYYKNAIDTLTISK